MMEPEDEDVDDGKFKFENAGVQNSGVQNGGVQNGGVPLQSQPPITAIWSHAADTLFGEVQLGPSSTPFGWLIQDGMEERPLVNARISTAPGFSGVSVMFLTRDGEGQREAHEEEGTVERRKRDNERKRNKARKKVG
ncbi:unnamed protein product [Arctogadus glacialis]